MFRYPLEVCACLTRRVTSIEDLVGSCCESILHDHLQIRNLLGGLGQLTYILTYNIKEKNRVNMIQTWRGGENQIDSKALAWAIF